MELDIPYPTMRFQSKCATLVSFTATEGRDQKQPGEEQCSNLSTRCRCRRIFFVSQRWSGRIRATKSYGCFHSWGNPEIIHLFIGFSPINHPFYGVPPFIETPIWMFGEFWFVYWRVPLQPSKFCEDPVVLFCWEVAEQNRKPCKLQRFVAAMRPVAVGRDERGGDLRGFHLILGGELWFLNVLDDCWWL